MKYDIAGFKIEEGMVVLIACQKGPGNYLYHAKVVKETPTGFKCEIFDAPKSCRWLNGEVVPRKPEQMIVISPYKIE